MHSLMRSNGVVSNFGDFEVHTDKVCVFFSWFLVFLPSIVVVQIRTVTQLQTVVLSTIIHNIMITLLLTAKGIIVSNVL